jgi:hypothetical protein
VKIEPIAEMLSSMIFYQDLPHGIAYEAICKEHVRAIRSTMALIHFDVNILPDPKRARKLFGTSKEVPQGAIFCGVLCDRIAENALVWLPPGWHCGRAGVLQLCNPSSVVQTTWLQAVRDGRDWVAMCQIAEVSKRTWEGWEQGRPMSAIAVYHLALTLESGWFRI